VKSCARVVREHPRHVLAAAIAAGLALARIDPTALFVVAAALAIGLSACESRPYVVIAASAFMLLGAGVGAHRLASIDADPLAGIGYGAAEVYGDVVQRPRDGPNGSTLRVRAFAPGGRMQMIEVRSRMNAPAGLRIGNEIHARGSLRGVSVRGARTPEAASYAEYLLRSGVRRRLEAKSIELTGRSRAGPTGFIDAVRNRADRALAMGLAPEPAALLRGMVLGGDAGLPETTADDFRIAGLSHILAVSGANVLLIVVLIQAMMIAANTPRWSRIVVPAIIVVIYVLLCGAQASVIRAGAMGLAGLAAIAASRGSSRVYAMLLAAIVVLLWNPRATADVGAQLSFAAVLGLMAFTRPIADKLRGVPRWAAEAFAATTGATIATAPLMAYHFGVISIVSLAANVLGEPLIGPIVWLGSLTAAVAQFSVPLAALLNAPNSFLLGVLIELAHASAAMPGAQAGTAGFGAVGLVAGLLAVAALAAIVHGWVPVSGRRVRQFSACGVALLTAFGFWRGGSAPIARPAIVMLDVGQGDATLLLGAGGCNALIDGGPPGDRLEKKLRAVGVKALDAVVTTHPETDHFGGILELAGQGDVPVKTLLDGGGNTPRPDYAQLRNELAAAGTGHEAAVAGATWQCGDISIHVIGPAPQAPDAAPPANPNTRAAVTVIDVGPMRMLASGDAESPQLLPLPLPPADILKTPHHGSADPGLAAVLERVRPSVALIGVGAQNRYGHPTPSALAAIAQEGAKIFRTDRDGEIIVQPGLGGAPAVSTTGPNR
jgi:competence protein ComEC